MSRRALARPLAVAALSGALTLSTPLAFADPGNGNGGKDDNSNGQSAAPGQQHKQGDEQDQDDDQDDDKGQQTKPSKPAKPTKPAQPGQSGEDADPAGNNGTVKIAPHGELDGIPQNTPHPGCVFDIEWYGFDEGSDVVSTVTFAMHAPTSDVGLSVDGPTEVFVGGDPATGAGTDTGLDGRETYTLAFDGEPHPKQGYHVKLTVETPRSQGNDSKTKVFWVEDCTEGALTDDASTDETDDETTDSDEGASSTDAESTDSESTDSGVLGTQLQADAQTSAGQLSTADSDGDDDAAVPTSVDAGALGGVITTLTGSPWSLVSLIGALLAGAGAIIASRRSRA